MQVCGINKIYRLRWRFDFLNKRSKTGHWDNQYTSQDDMACMVKKEGLTRASIEAVRLGEYGIITMLEVDGQDYVTCQDANISYLSSKTHHIVSNFIGLSFIVGFKRVTIFIDGTRKIEAVNQKGFNSIFEHRG